MLESWDIPGFIEMPINPAAIAAIAAEELDDMFRDAGDVLKDGEANYLRDGEPGSVTGRIAQAAGRSACRIYSTGTVDLTPRGKQLYENRCRPYLDTIYPITSPSVKTPFSGGQCAGAIYNVTIGVSVEIIFCPDGPVAQIATDTVQFNGLVGPITEIGTEDVPGFPSSCGNPQRPYVVANGVRSNQNFGFLNSGSLGNRNQQLTITVVRVDGQPDNCGSPPPIIGQPDTNPDPMPPPFRFNPAPDIDVDIDVELNPDGSIDIDIGTGPVSINPTVEINPGGEGGGDGGPPPGDVGEPGDSGETGEGGDTDGEAPAGSVLVGLKIDFVSPPVGGNEYKAGIFRGVCYIYMGTSEGVDHDPAGAMLRDGQFIFAEKDNLTTWFVSANQGYNLRVTPYYRPVEGEE